LEHGEYEAACAKLAESQRLDPSSGTLLNVAKCHEKQGKLATAWADYLAAARLARTQGMTERAEEANRRAAELESNLSYLTIVVADPAPGLVIQRDKVTLESTTLGSRIPTDPGEHLLTVSAPGKESITLKVTIGAAKDAQTVTVPALRDSAPSSVVEPTKKTETAARDAGPPRATADEVRKAPLASTSSSRHTWAFVLGGVGIAGLGVGATFGFLARSSYDDAEKRCPSHRGCPEDALSARDDANVRANVANVAVGVGVVSLGVGTWLFFTSGSSKAEAKDRTVRVVPAVASRQAGLLIHGSF
jgi:hypothetical protein